MKTASLTLQAIGLMTVLAGQFIAPGEFRMPGLRRAIQTLADQPKLVAPVGFMIGCQECEDA